ncbi:MAG TPA: DUF72 domain-containing protein [Candidatus Hydrogenedentes bacterium]|nr:DUF72 domain-containing protein [Candidatus Hydrogenedentota bacterium]HNT87255.1 DUF72 domain-containing protein [Candidatus Hydrogenedentota bacterium]
MPEELQGVVRVGPAGWSYEDWKGVVYPTDVPRRIHALAFLSRFFDAVEVNATFYRPPDARLAAAWVRHVADNPRFRFSVKLWRRYTHDREDPPTERETRQFLEGIQPLVAEERLGALLIQFPWNFQRTVANREWLARLAERFASYPLAIELRHASWDQPTLYKGLAERGAAFCNIDQPLFDHSIAPSAHTTAPMGYVRFHGRNAADWFREGAGRNERYNYLYGEDELKPWIQKITQMRERLNELYVITNNHYRGQAVVNALEIQAAVQRGRVRAPAPLLEAYPRLAEVADPDTRT